MPFDLTIVTPQGEAYRGAVEAVVLPGTEGDFGVLEGHERLLAALRMGPLQIRSSTGTSWAGVTDGFAEVTHDRVVVLVDGCDRAAEIDTAAAERDQREAQEALRDLEGGEETAKRRAELERAAARAALRIDIAGRA